MFATDSGERDGGGGLGDACGWWFGDLESCIDGGE